jgi:hypothetical protein
VKKPKVRVEKQNLCGNPWALCIPVRTCVYFIHVFVLVFIHLCLCLYVSVRVHVCMFVCVCLDMFCESMCGRCTSRLSSISWI